MQTSAHTFEPRAPSLTPPKKSQLKGDAKEKHLRAGPFSPVRPHEPRAFRDVQSSSEPHSPASARAQPSSRLPWASPLPPTPLGYTHSQATTSMDFYGQKGNGKCPRQRGAGARQGGRRGRGRRRGRVPNPEGRRSQQVPGRDKRTPLETCLHLSEHRFQPGDFSES